MKKTKIVKFDHSLLSHVFDNRDFILGFLNDNLQDIIEEGLGAFGIENNQPSLAPSNLSSIAKGYVTDKLKSTTNAETLAGAFGKLTKNPLQHLKNTAVGIKSDASELINKNLIKLPNALKRRTPAYG